MRLPGSPRLATGAAFAWAGSIALHLAVSFAVLRHVQPSSNAPAAPPPCASSVVLELPVFTEAAAPSNDGTSPTSRDEVVVPPAAPPVVRGGEEVPRLDSERVGRGGETADEAALNLADKDEALRRSPDLRDRLDRDQEQRLDAAKHRSTWEDRRSTTHPMELSFLASGDGEQTARRPEAPTDPSRGLLVSPPPRAAGAAAAPRAVLVDAELVGAAPAPALASREATEAREARETGARDPAPGLGVRGAAEGADHRASASVVRARPDVTLAPPSVPAAVVARPADDRDSEQAVATAVQSLVHASAAGGAPGAGRGGTVGGGAAGADGRSGEGSRPQPLGSGAGEVFDIDTRDPRLVPYFRKLHARIDPLTEHAFPTSARLDLEQGTVILDFVIHADGSVSVAPPRRPSGIPEFDANCAAAIRKAAPFEPPPAVLAGPARDLHVRAPFASTRQW